MPWWCVRLPTRDVRGVHARSTRAVEGATLAQLAAALAAGAIAPFERGVASATPVLANTSVWARPEIAMGLALALLPGLAWLSWRLYHWGERLSALRLIRGAHKAK